MEQERHRSKNILHFLMLAILIIAVVVGPAPMSAPIPQPLPPVTEMSQVTKECQELTARKVGILCEIVFDTERNPTLSLDFADLEVMDEHWEAIAAARGFGQAFVETSNRQKKKGLIILTLVKEEMFKVIYCDKHAATSWMHFSVLPFVPYILGTPEPRKQQI